MTTTFITTNTIGAGTQFTFAAAGDALVVLPGVTLGSTTGSAIANGGFSDVEISVLGTLVSIASVSLGANSSFSLSTGANFVSFQASSGNSGLFFFGGGGLAQIDGTLNAPECIGILTDSGNSIINVTGTISAASGVYLGLFNAPGDILVNSGNITANAQSDASNDTRFNNAVFTEGANTRITNQVGGEITATSPEGNGVRIGVGANGSLVINHGTITSVNAAGVEFFGLTVAQSATLINTGVIAGRVNSFASSGMLGNAIIHNGGHMIGNVVFGAGAELCSTRSAAGSMAPGLVATGRTATTGAVPR